jgi:hypothetical protein
LEWKRNVGYLLVAVKLDERVHLDDLRRRGDDRAAVRGRASKHRERGREGERRRRLRTWLMWSRVRPSPVRVVKNRTYSSSVSRGR